MDSDAKRHCRKCLTDRLQSQYFQSMQEYIDSMDEDVRAESAVYEARTLVCMECDKLSDGLCLACGCFAGVRAAVRENACPYGKWQAQKTERGKRGNNA